MNKTNVKGYRRMLEAKRRELLSSYRDTEGIAVERVPDSMDEFSLEVQRSMSVDALNRKAALFRQVTEALERIAGGEYGVCLACNEAISAKRLAALPWAPLCFECQQATENRLGTDARECVSLRPGYGVSNSGEQLANSSRGHDHRLRRSVVPRAPANGGASKSEAREARI
jgi:DnaK suppressor protein